MCSRILWNSNQLAVVVSRAMDWPGGTDPKIVVFPRGAIRNGSLIDDSVVVGGHPVIEISIPLDRMHEPRFGRECESARGSQADRHVKLLIQFAVEGVTLGRLFTLMSLDPSTILADFARHGISQISFSVTHGLSARGGADHGRQESRLAEGAWPLSEVILESIGSQGSATDVPCYVSGLVGSGDRKSVQPMAERLALGDYDQLYHGLGCQLRGKRVAGPSR